MEEAPLAQGRGRARGAGRPVRVIFHDDKELVSDRAEGWKRRTPKTREQYPGQEGAALLCSVIYWLCDFGQAT